MLITGLTGIFSYGIGKPDKNYPNPINVSKILNCYDQHDVVDGLPFIIESIYSALEINTSMGEPFDKGLIVLGVLIRDMDLYKSRDDHHVADNVIQFLNSIGIHDYEDIHKIINGKLEHRLNGPYISTNLFSHIMWDSSKVFTSNMNLIRAIGLESRNPRSRKAGEYLDNSIQLLMERLDAIDEALPKTAYGLKLHNDFKKAIRESTIRRSPNKYFSYLFAYDSRMRDFSRLKRDQLPIINEVAFL